MSKIAMTCDRSGHKEIYIMDWDGKNPKQITHHKSTAFAPSWNPQGNKLAYSVFTKNSKNIKTISLFEYDFVTKKTRVLSDRPGINSGANYHPTKNLLALTMSYTGNPEIFTLDPSTQSITKLTKSYGVEVDPSWSPDGQQLVFISSRNGNPMVYKMNADGTGATRLTFVGKYNATPHWSPANNKIVFASWTTDGNKNGFDLFIMNPDATKLERLTKNQGSNEDPQFSPDGQSVVYTSTRAGGQNIFVTSVSGQTTRQLSQQLGNCTTPKWSTPNPQLP
jgi:TolB protein